MTTLEPEVVGVEEDADDLDIDDDTVEGIVPPLLADLDCVTGETCLTCGAWLLEWESCGEGETCARCDGEEA